MKLEYSDILNKHKNTPCFIALHGPSLTNEIKLRTQELQKEKKLLRISVNNWFDFFDTNPDYWVVSNSEFTIENSMKQSNVWDYYDYEKNCFNKYNVPLFYNTTADLTTEEFINKNLKCDYLPYDTRHFKQHDCIKILNNFKDYYNENKNFNFKFYGNNSQIWQRPNVKGLPDWKKKLHGRIAGGFDTRAKCCNNIGTTTLQEQLQNLSGHSQHMGTGQTVGVTALAFAVLMGCNPIYFTGMDLDCEKGYAQNKNYNHTKLSINQGHIGHWKHIFKDFLLDDMRIIKQSAELMGIKIINLNSKSWYNTFEFGNLPEE